MVRRVFRLLDRIVPSFARSMGWETLLAAVSFPASILLNRALGAEQRGVLALTLLVPTTIFAIGTCQWERLSRGLVASRAISAREAWRRTLSYAPPLSLVFVPVGIAASLLYPGLPFEPRLWSSLYCLNLPVYFIGGTLQNVLLAAGALNLQYWMRLTMQGGYLLLLFPLLAIGHVTPAAIVGLYFAIHFLSLVVGVLFSKRVLVGSVETRRPDLRPLARAFPPLAAEVIAGKVDVWAFSLFGTLVGVGQYAGLSALMLPVGLVSNALVSSSTARLDWTNPLAIRRYLGKATIALCSLCAAIGVGGMLFGLRLLNVLLGKSFADGEWMIPWITIIVVGQSMAHQFHTSVQLSGLSSAFLKIQSADSIIRFALVMAGAASLGEPGILLALIVTAVTKLAWSAYALLSAQNAAAAGDTRAGGAA